MRSIYIAIPEGVAEQLRVLASREFRSPRQQAAMLIVDGLKRAGLPVEVASREQSAGVEARGRR